MDEATLGTDSVSRLPKQKAVFSVSPTMTRMFKYSLLLLLFGCLTQLRAHNNAGYTATVISRIVDNDTTRMLYCQKNTGEQIRVYRVESGLVSAATEYTLAKTRDGFILRVEPLTGGQLNKDSLLISFDKDHTLIINHHDRYVLFPAFYQIIKSQLVQQHQLMPLLYLLCDAIGDYPLEQVMPLLLFKQSTTEHILSARIVTRRSQADMTDNWNVKYRYSNHRLTAISAVNKEETRFTKTINYKGKRCLVNTYRNIESRQTVNQTIVLNGDDPNRIRLNETVYESGKDRETNSKITFVKLDLGKIAHAEMTTAVVVRLIAGNGNTERNK